MAKAGQAPAPYIAQKYAEAETAEKAFLSDDYDEPESDQDLEVDQAVQGPDQLPSIRYTRNQLAPVGELLSSSEDEDGRGSIDGCDPASQQASDPVEAASTSGDDIDVWDNLKQIFADMDAQEDNDENKLLLKEPLARLRRLLAMHNDMAERERALRRCHLGVLVERDWYLGKLREVEDTVESTPAKSSSEAADVAFSGAVRSILYRESSAFRLAGSKGRG